MLLFWSAKLRHLVNLQGYIDIIYPSAGRVRFLGSVQWRLRSPQRLLGRHYRSVYVRREGFVARLYHQVFHLELTRASFHP